MSRFVEQLLPDHRGGARAGAAPSAGGSAWGPVGAELGAQSDKIFPLLAADTLSANALVAGLGLKSRTGAFKRTIKELLELKWVAYTMPDKPNSRLQQYRLTEQVRQTLARQQSATRDRTDD